MAACGWPWTRASGEWAGWRRFAKVRAASGTAAVVGGATVGAATWYCCGRAATSGGCRRPQEARQLANGLRRLGGVGNAAAAAAASAAAVAAVAPSRNGVFTVDVSRKDYGGGTGGGAAVGQCHAAAMSRSAGAPLVPSGGAGHGDRTLVGASSPSMATRRSPDVFVIVHDCTDDTDAAVQSAYLRTFLGESSAPTASSPSSQERRSSKLTDSVKWTPKSGSAARSSSYFF